MLRDWFSVSSTDAMHKVVGMTMTIFSLTLNEQLCNRDLQKVSVEKAGFGKGNSGYPSYLGMPFPKVHTQVF